jgi:DNA-binding CsgD family transcriptional regulator
MKVAAENAIHKLKTIQALPVSIAILDGNGRIIGVNATWEQFGRRNGLHLPRAAVGLNYLDYCKSPSSSQLLKDLRALLAGRLDLLTLIYPCHSPTKKRWFVLSGMPLSLGEPSGVALLHTDLTELLPPSAISTVELSRRARHEIRLPVNVDMIGASVEHAISEGLASQLTKMLTAHGAKSPRRESAVQGDHVAPTVKSLSRRQLQVLRLLGEGKTNKQISRTLGRSPNTIKLHVSAILRYLKLKNRTQAAVLASEFFASRSLGSDRQAQT